MARLSRYTDAQIFRRFSPVLLAQFFSTYENELRRRGISLPSDPNADNMPYDQIASLFFHADPSLIDLFDAILMIGKVSSEQGRGAIHEAAAAQDVQIPAHISSAYDIALWSWLYHPAVVEQAGYRITMHKARSFFYFSSMLEENTPPFDSSDEAIERFASAMESLYSASSKGGKVKLLVESAGDEVWLLIRHGGYLERRGDINNDTGEVTTVCFRDEEYDVLVYNQRYRELKIRNNTDKIVSSMRFHFGQVFFGSGHMFVRRETFPLALLQGNDFSFLNATRIPGIFSVRLAEIRYSIPGAATTQIHAKSTDLLQSADSQGRIVPENATVLNYVKLHVRFDRESRPRSVELFSPNKSSFARESDAPLVEQWLRSACLMQKGEAPSADDTFFSALKLYLGRSLTLNEWKQIFASSFDRAQPFLMETDKDATYWCSPNSSERRDILRAEGEITALSPDYEASPSEERRKIPPEEIRLFKLCPCSLSVRLSALFGVDHNFCSLNEGIYRLGTLRGPDRRRHQAFLLAHPERTSLSMAQQVFGQEGDGIILVTPEYCPETASFSDKRKLFYVPLKDMLLPPFNLVQTFDESKKQFFAIQAEKELITKEQLAGFLAIAKELDANSSRSRPPTHTEVLQRYCVDSLSTEEIEKKCGCSHGTVMNRKSSLERKIGRPLSELRMYSDHFEDIEKSLHDSRAKFAHRKSAIMGESAYDDD